MAKVNFTTPIGRLVRGSLYKPRTQDAEGKPLVIKSGQNAGQPRVDYYFEIAVPKAPGQTHWATKPADWESNPVTAGRVYWGEAIWNQGHLSFPQGQAQWPSFAWKVTDGDSQVPNRKNKKPCDQIGYPGNWVIRFSSGFPPKIFNADGSQQIVQPDAVKPGYYVQVNGDVDGNGSQQQPGVFISHNMVAMAGYGEEIVFGPDPAAAGFGGGALPPGASAVPVGGGFAPTAPGAPGAPTPPAPAAYGQPGTPGMAPPPAGGVPSASPSRPPAAPPNPAFLGVPPGAPVPGMAPPPPAAPAAPAGPQRTLTAKAGGATYEQLIQAGWTDQTLVQHGLMIGA